MLNGLLALGNSLSQAVMSKSDKESLASTRDEDVLLSQHDLNSDSFVGTGLSLEFDFNNTKDIELEIQSYSFGHIRLLEFKNIEGLTDDETEEIESFITSITESVHQLFKGIGSEQLFGFSNSDGFSNIELTARQNDGTLKQSLEFELENQSPLKKEVTSNWYQKNYETGVSDEHHFKLEKTLNDISSGYGQVNQQWLKTQLATGLSVFKNELNLNGFNQKNALSSYFKSGLDALLNESNKAIDALSGMGVSSKDARQLIGQSIQAANPSQSDATGEAKASEFDLKLLFSSVREMNNQADKSGEYDFLLTIHQQSKSTYDQDTETRLVSQFKKVALDFQQQQLSSHLELLWRSDEKNKMTLDQSEWVNQHYSLKDGIQLTNTHKNGTDIFNSEYSETIYRQKSVSTPVQKLGIQAYEQIEQFKEQQSTFA